MPSTTPRKLTVWPYFFLAIVAGLLGTTFVLHWWPEGYPDKGSLTKISGEVATVQVRDDFSDTSAGAILPGFTSVYFTFEGVDGEFSYPFTHPRYFQVRDATAVAIDIWIDPADLADDGTATIWQIEERNPHDKPGDETSISYEEVIERLSSSDQAMVRLGGALLVGGAIFLAVGLGVRHFNRRGMAKSG